MTNGEFRADVQPGDGVVARYGDLALVVAPGGGPFTDALVRLLTLNQDDPRTLVWQVAGLVAAHQPGAPAFVLVAGGPPTSRVLVHGAARVLVDNESVGGTGSWTWVERLFEGHTAITATVADGAVSATPHSDLRDGVLAGDGLVLATGTVPVSPTPTAAPQPAFANASAFSPEAPLRSTGASVFTPLPSPTHHPSATPTPSVGRAAIVTPRPPTEDEVGTAIAAGPSLAVPVGGSVTALHADDGTRVPLDRDYVFGRDPRQDPTVVRGMSTPIQVDDGEQLISRIHAHVAVSAAGVTVRDAGSANGTFVAAPGAGSWTRIGTAPVPVPVGHSIRFGLRVYTHVPAEDISA